MSSLDRNERITSLFRLPVSQHATYDPFTFFGSLDHLQLQPPLSGQRSLSSLSTVHSFKPVRQTLAGPSVRAFHVLRTR